ncbi:MAG: hypothetical protein ACYSW3_17305 [Planctomycetota bacterium]
MKKKMKKMIMICAALVLFPGLVYDTAHATLPAITTHIYDANAIADGYVFLSVSTDVEGVGYYVMIIDNDGTIFWSKELPDDYSYDFKVLPKGTAERPSPLCPIHSSSYLYWRRRCGPYHTG